jgi:hypothetical protein
LLIESLRPLVGPRYKIRERGVVGGAAAESAPLPIVIFAPDADGALKDDDPIPANTAAVVVDVIDELDIAKLDEAYQRIASVKALDRPEHPETPNDGVDATLAAIFARRAAVPMETITDRLQALNAETPGTQWPDIVAIGDAGVIEYAVQFPGEAELGGSWLLPSRRLPAAPAIYVVMMKGPAPGAALTRATGRMLQSLHLFRKDAGLPADFHTLVAPFTDAIAATGYQYDLEGELRPVPDEFYSDRLVPEAPLQLLPAGGGEPLGSLRYLPWQDGGAIVMNGRFPLQGMLVFSGLPAERQTILRRPPDRQVSYVLPMSRPQFLALLQRFEQRSNLRVRLPPQQFIVQKVADEGTSSPYVARLMLGLLIIRDLVYRQDEAARLAFDRTFEGLTQALSSTRKAAKEVTRLWTEHATAVQAGEAVERSFNKLTIKQSIDRELRREAENFLNSSVRALKHNMQVLARQLGVELAFLFQKQPTFDAGCARLEQTDPDLANYLRGTRGWSEQLVLARNAIEHEGWVLPGVTYRDSGGAVTAVEPEIDGIPVTAFAARMLDRFCCFMEDVTVHLFQSQLEAPLAIAEVLPPGRKPVSPERFVVTFALGGREPWRIAYSETPFLDR